MKKLFFFRSSSGNGTDKQVHCEKEADSKMKTKASSQAEQEFDSPKSQGQVSGGPALRRSLSWSSAGFLFDKFGETSTNELTSATKSQDRRRNHSSRYAFRQLHSYEIFNWQFSIVLVMFIILLLYWFDFLTTDEQCDVYCVPDVLLQKGKLEKGSVKQTSFNMIHLGVRHLVLVLSLVKFWTVILMEKSI